MDVEFFDILFLFLVKIQTLSVKNSILFALFYYYNESTTKGNLPKRRKESPEGGNLP